jgi:hypothetical protein
MTDAPVSDDRIFVAQSMALQRDVVCVRRMRTASEFLLSMICRSARSASAKR